MVLLASNVLRKANKVLVPCLEEKMLDTQEIIPFNISPNMYTHKVQHMWTKGFIRLIYGVPDKRHGIYDSVCKCTFCIYKQTQSIWNYIIMMKCNSTNIMYTTIWSAFANQITMNCIRIQNMIKCKHKMHMLHGSKSGSWYPQSLSPFCWFSRGFRLHFPKRQTTLSASSRQQ